MWRPKARCSGCGAPTLERFAPLLPIFATDQPSSSTITRQALGWQPAHPSLLDDLENIQT